MVEQTLVITLFIEHSDMHIYTLQKWKEENHVIYDFLSRSRISNKGESLEAKKMKGVHVVSVTCCLMDALIQRCET